MKKSEFNKVIEMCKILDHELTVENSILKYCHDEINEIRFDDEKIEFIKVKDYNSSFLGNEEVLLTISINDDKAYGFDMVKEIRCYRLHQYDPIKLLEPK